MATPLLTTKLYIPPTRSELVPRPRLTERLNQGMRGKLTLVSAPAGFGKTTLLSEWVREYERPTAWVSLDQSDNELVGFLTYLIAALQGIDEGIGVDAKAALGAPHSPSVETLLSMLINDVAAFDKELNLILDDCHRVDAQPIHDALDFMLDHLPANMHLVLSGRVDPLISLSRLRVGGQLTEIRQYDLRFTKAEVATFLNDLMSLDLSPEDIAALETRTEGWIASLQLAALSLQGRQDRKEFIAAFSGSHYYIIDYLVFERPIYNYLLRMTQNQAEAEDLTQETFIRVHRSLPTFRGEASLSTWIYRIATNVSLDYFRRRATRQARAALSLEETQSEGEWVIDETASSPEQVATQSEMSDCVQSFIWRLPPSYRTVMVLHDLQGLKNREIADVLDCSLHTVKIRLHRARKKLRATLDAGCDFAHDERNVFVCEPKQTETEEAGG